MKRLWKCIKCLLGFHDWQFGIYPARHGYIYGLKCSRCYLNHPTMSVAVPYNAGYEEED